jgi:hypothetical protein
MAQWAQDHQSTFSRQLSSGSRQAGVAQTNLQDTVKLRDFQFGRDDLIHV